MFLAYGFQKRRRESSYEGKKRKKAQTAEGSMRIARMAFYCKDQRNSRGNGLLSEKAQKTRSFSMFLPLRVYRQAGNSKKAVKCLLCTRDEWRVLLARRKRRDPNDMA